MTALPVGNTRIQCVSTIQGEWRGRLPSLPLTARRRYGLVGRTADHIVASWQLLAKTCRQRATADSISATLHRSDSVSQRSTSPTPPASTPSVRRRMQSTRQRDTPPEIALRSTLHRMGLRFRVDRPIEGVPRVRPDIVFVSARVAVFVDGCFWHACPKHGTIPKTNTDWWIRKLRLNVERDRRHDAALSAAGWKVIRIWQHEDPEKAARLIFEVVKRQLRRDP